MKAAVARKPLIRVAVVESDPLRFVGFRALFDTEPDLELVSASLADLSQLPNIDLVLLGNRGGQNLYDIMASMKAVRPDLRIIVTGSGMDDESVLKAIAAGAKGYVDEAASPAEFIQALRIVHQGSVWAPRRVLSTFIERVSASPGRIFPAGRIAQPGETIEPHDGAVVLALRIGAPIIPVHVSGTRYNPSMLRSYFRRHKARVRFGSPIDLSSYGKNPDKRTLHELTRMLLDRVDELG